MTPSKSKTICEFNKNPGELVRISLAEFKGKKYLSLWVFYDASEDQAPDWRPSKKGICLSVDLLDDLREGIEKATAEVQEKKKPSGLGENGGGHGPDDSAGAETSREGRADSADKGREA